ncbi:hypothetical protein [Stenotrophomonas phage RAS14]
MDEQYKTYLEFHKSNWYAYWDTDSAPVRNRQELLAWHIDIHEHGMEFGYKPVKELVSSGEFVKKVMTIDKCITESDALDLQAAAICFINGVEGKYPV